MSPKKKADPNSGARARKSAKSIYDEGLVLAEPWNLERSGGLGPEASKQKSVISFYKIGARIFYNIINYRLCS
jgi:hypothetical protein